MEETFERVTELHGVHGGEQHDAAANGRGQAPGTMDRALSEPGKAAKPLFNLNPWS